MPMKDNISQEVAVDLAWTKELSIGNATIDSDHKKLIDMINRIKHEIRATNCSAISQAFKRLEDWLPTHSINEEKIARAIHFPFEQHDLAHQHNMRELQYLRDELISKDGIWSEGAVKHFCRFLENWALEHITKIDMPMKQVLLEHPYDFQPD